MHSSIKWPVRLRVLVNNRALIDISIPDHYTRREYMGYPDYVPRDGCF
jgi:hypothetical protein